MKNNKLMVSVLFLAFLGLACSLDCYYSPSTESKDLVYCPITQNPGENWQYLREISFNPATPITDYQVKIELNLVNFDYSHAESDGSDLRFYDYGQTKLNYGY